MVYECKVDSFSFNNNKKITNWNSTGVLNISDYYGMKGVKDTKNEMPILKNDEKMYVYLKGSHFQQNYVLTTSNDQVINDNVINIYIIYKLDPIATSRGKTTLLYKIPYLELWKLLKLLILVNIIIKDMVYVLIEEKNLLTYEKEAILMILQWLLIFGVDMSFSKHANNERNNIYVMGKDYVQRINDTTLYAEKIYYRNFTDLGHKFVLSLHYNGNNSYLYVNGNQELKFKAKTDQLVKEKLCLGNLSHQWTTSESEKTGLHGKIYDFVVDYEQITGTAKILDMHRYLINKHNIIS